MLTSTQGSARYVMVNLESRRVSNLIQAFYMYMYMYEREESKSSTWSLQMYNYYYLD